MSERLLKALMELFALISEVEHNEDGSIRTTGTGRGRDVVLDFLNKQLSHDQVEEYIGLFDQFLETHHGSGKGEKKRKRTSVNSVKVLKICTHINEELEQKQKMIVLLRILEFINADVVTEQELEFAVTVAETFNISREEFDDCRLFVESKGEKQDSQNILVINNMPDEKFAQEYTQCRHIFSEGSNDDIRVLRIQSVGLFFLRYFGTQDLFLNGQVISNDRTYVLTHGSSVRSPQVKPIYHSDVIARFLSDINRERITFKAEDVAFRFKNGGIGLHTLNIAEEAGSLFGIMGGSGAGKSTLLNVLNGNYKPTEGKVTINGIDIHSKEAKEKMDGVIGYVSQDDLLIEELSVFDNLYFNAKLCFSNKSDKEIRGMVEKLLADLGLSETRNLKVGSPLQKTISGGQRKRVNIGLELIREPAVLFVDEPTSGLSSRDSQNIMDLLKELSLKGKLIFVVIHQPSSDIFKMFDKLFILDRGGYSVYYGNPVDGIEYFKTLANYANAAGDTSGNVNPEEIFDIIDSKVVDEYGNLTNNRKVSPKEWYETYNEKIAPNLKKITDPDKPPKVDFKRPNPLMQFMVFLRRDILSKISNTQYILINALEAPLLAGILAYFVKYYRQEFDHSEFIYSQNENLPQFLFISVVVALFIGLTVSAEEIIKDQKILKREKFLNLSKTTYLNSKIVIMFLISAIQMIMYAVVGNLILEIKGLTIEYWLVLFSTSCFANALGLNISASFNSAKVIYILIPLLIIPQLLFSGVIVKFDKLHPSFSSEGGVPIIGNVMASRWAYEALAVTTYKDNAYEKLVFDLELEKKYSTWKKDLWLTKLREYRDFAINNYNVDSLRERVDHSLLVIRNELKKEEMILEESCECADELTYDNLFVDGGVNMEPIRKFDKYCESLKVFYREIFDEANKQSEEIIMALQDEMGKEEFQTFRDAHVNKALSDFVTNKNSLDKIVEDKGELIQKSFPIYALPYGKSFFDSHFYAPKKKLFGKWYSTFTANLMVIWGMTLLLIVFLYFDVMRRTLEGFGKLFALVGKISGKKKKR
jgi:ABC transport system ATP-binding/permease protein